MNGAFSTLYCTRIIFSRTRGNECSLKGIRALGDKECEKKYKSSVKYTRLKYKIETVGIMKIVAYSAFCLSKLDSQETKNMELGYLSKTKYPFFGLGMNTSERYV